MLKRWKDYQDGLTQQLDCKRKYLDTSHTHRTLVSNKETVLEHENLALNSVISRVSVTSALVYLQVIINTNKTLITLALFEKKQNKPILSRLDTVR